jgi:hypothetical protein
VLKPLILLLFMSRTTAKNSEITAGKQQIISGSRQQCFSMPTWLCS